VAGRALEPDYNRSRRVDLDTLTRQEVASWNPEKTLLSLWKDAHRTRRRAQAHSGHAGEGEKLPVDFTNRVIYYVGPWTRCATKRSDRRPDDRDAHGQVHGMMLAQTGLIAMVARRSVDRPQSRRSEAQERLPHGGRRCRVPRRESRSSARVLGFADLGMEAIYEFDVKDMPVTVAVDANGTSVHNTGPRSGRRRSARSGAAA